MESSAARKLLLSDFRNYASAEVELSKGHNVFLGANGQGKSNLLEAIYALATTRSFRASRDQDLIRFGSDESAIALEVGDEAVQIRLCYSRRGRRAAFLFGERLPRVQDIVGRFPAISFSSADLAIVSGEPSDRRRFLDSEICLLSPSYLKAFSTYRKVLEHRNACLKSVREGAGVANELEPWDFALSESGAILRTQREQYVGEIARLAAAHHSMLSGDAESIAISFAPQDESKTCTELQDGFANRRQIDIQAGISTYGPHRDNVVISIDGVSAKPFGSQGQQRTTVLAIKLAVVSYWKDNRGQIPALLLDDIMSDLDEKRRAMVMEVSGGLGQVFITATDMSQVLPEVRSGAKVFHIVEGTVKEG